MTKTENYQLNQWDASDYVRREDFNEDNRKIEEAIAGAGNCRIAAGTYIGTGECGVSNPTILNLDFEPKLVIIKQKYSDALPTFIVGGDSVAKSITHIFGGGNLQVSSNGNLISWYHTGGSWSATGSSSGASNANLQLNAENMIYFYICIG